MIYSRPQFLEIHGYINRKLNFPPFFLCLKGNFLKKILGCRLLLSSFLLSDFLSSEFLLFFSRRIYSSSQNLLRYFFPPYDFSRLFFYVTFLSSDFLPTDFPCKISPPVFQTTKFPTSDFSPSDFLTLNFLPI